MTEDGRSGATATTGNGHPYTGDGSEGDGRGYNGPKRSGATSTTKRTCTSLEAGLVN